MAKYIIYKIEVTPAHLSIDRKKHTHKYYYYPVPANLKGLGFGSHWSYKDGKRGAVRFTNKAKAMTIAKANGAYVEECKG